VLEAYSRLSLLLEERGMTQADLRQRVATEERPPGLRSLARLADPDRPLERIDLRVAGAVCRALGIGLGDLIAFAEPGSGSMRTLPAEEQRRLDELMERHGEGAVIGRRA
jgi:DNA-binding Xre family transcriptional regulator